MAHGTAQGPSPTTTGGHAQSNKSSTPLFCLRSPASSAPAQALSIAAIANVIATQDEAITPIKVKASGGGGAYTYSIASNPAAGSGLSINASNGQITGTPTQTGTFTLTVTVTDNESTTATERFSMAVCLIGDFNDDGAVNESDFSLFQAAFGFSEGDDGFNVDMDLNGDGTIGIPDFLIFVSHYPGTAARFF